MNGVMRLLLLGLAVLLACAPAASAASRNQVIRDCADDGRLQGNYTNAELRDARNNLPADVDEYTDCRDVLRNAEIGGATSGGGGAGAPLGGGSGGGGASGDLLTAATPEEHHELRLARENEAEAVELAGRDVAPTGRSFAAYAARHDLPWHVIAVLALIALAALAAAAPAIRRRVLARRASPA